MKLVLHVMMAMSGRTQTQIRPTRAPENVAGVVEIRFTGGGGGRSASEAILHVGEKIVAGGTFRAVKPGGDYWLVDGDELLGMAAPFAEEFPWLSGQRYIRPEFEFGNRIGRETGDVVLRFGLNEWNGAAATTWEVSWEPVVGWKPRGGGQGTVLKVRRRSDGVLGALKTLHDEYAGDSTRRYRMHREAEALRFMSGDGAPEVLDANTTEYQRATLPLYVVTRFVDGPTLGEYVGKKDRLPIDEAIVVVNRIAETLRKLHAAGSHRDLKPDNVILEGGAPDSAIVVDFGMASSIEANDDGFETSADQELGNRFLRLPEFGAGRHSWDARSDITFVVALMFYMVTGRSPRALQDANGQAPHELLDQDFEAVLGRDPRWQRLKRLFAVGFQHRIDRRFQSIDDFLAPLGNLTPYDSDVDASEDLERLRDLMTSSTAREGAELQELMLGASRLFLDKIQKGLSTTGCTAGGNGPNVVAGGRTVDIQVYAVGKNPHPKVQFSHQIRATQTGFVSGYHVEDGQPVEYYHGPLADPESLNDAARSAGNRVLRSVARLLTYKMDRDLKARSGALRGEPAVAGAGLEAFEGDYPLGLRFRQHGSFVNGAPPIVATKEFSLEILLKNNAGARLDDFQLDVQFPVEFTPRSDERFVIERNAEQVRFQVRNSHHPGEKLLPEAVIKTLMIAYRIDAPRFQDSAALAKHVFFTVRSGDSRYSRSLPVADLSPLSPEEQHILRLSPAVS